MSSTTPSYSDSTTSTWTSTSNSSTSLMDVESETSRGISIKGFLMLAFCLKKDAFKKLYAQASAWTAEPEFVEKLKECELRAKERHDCAIESVEYLGNIALTSAMDDLYVAAERRIKLVYTEPLGIDDESQPDLAIVPASVSDKALMNNGKFDWRHVLGSLQVWFPLESRGTKRKFTVDDDARTDPSPKRSRAPTSRDVATAVKITTADDRDSYSDTSTDVRSCRSNATDWSSDAMLCRRSAEGELIAGFSSVFSAKGDRCFAIGACIYGTRMKLMFCSHSGLIESDEVDFALEPQLFAMFIFMFATSSLSNLGFNTSTGFCNPFNVDDPETRRVSVKLETFRADNNQATQPSLDRVLSGQKIVSQPGIVGRTTAVYRLEVPQYSIGLVMKYSWQVKTRCREDKIVRAAREADPVHTPELFGTAVVENDSTFESLRNACRRKSKNYQARELRVMVMREYLPLSELGFGDDFWDAYVQLLGCAHDLYKKKRILHHDISMKNLAFYRDENGKLVAVLIDFDLATMPPLQAASREGERVGTVAFMARDYLLSPDCNYGFHHDLESFLYCAVWHGFGYEVNKNFPCDEGSADDILIDWRIGDFRQMANYKICFMTHYFGLELLNKISDKEYARKCKLLWQKFKMTYAALLEETATDEEKAVLMPPSCSDQGRKTKVTYPMLTQALNPGHVMDACKEDCCWQLRSSRKNRHAV